MKYIISESKDDLRKMAELGEENYGKENDISSVDYLEWQSYKNPAGNAVTSLAYELENEIAGECMLVSYQMKAFKELVTAACIVNTLIRKKDRALVVFHSLHKLAFDKHGKNSLVYAVPNPHSYPLFTKVFKFKTIGQIPLLLVPMRPKALAKAKINQKLATVMPDIVIKKRRVKLSDGWKITKVTEIGAEVFDDFWQAVDGKYNILGVRNAEYIRWRYFHCPRREYDVFMLWKGSVPVGYAAVRMMEVDGIKNGMLVDFLSVTGCETEMEALASHCLDYFRQNGAELVGTLMLPHCAEYKILKNAGFVVCPEKFLPQPFPLIVKTFDEKHSNFEKIDNWFITMGDYDAV